jgi:hypothetical protein
MFITGVDVRGEGRGGCSPFLALEKGLTNGVLISISNQCFGFEKAKIKINKKKKM